jgi:hypothetical protein
MSGGGGGVIIIRPRARVMASDAVVTENLTPAECAVRDAILAKADGDWEHKDLVKLFALVAKAARRCT